jgi:hypothetical protein
MTLKYGTIQVHLIQKAMVNQKVICNDQLMKARNPRRL